MDKKSHKEWTLQTAIEQLESCNFTCDAGPLAHNDAFIWLKELAAKGNGPLSAEISKILGGTE